MSVKTAAERRERTLFLVETAMLTAIIIIMAFTPLGFLKSGVIEITFLAVPVAVGAVMMGWKGGLILGTVFGLVSFAQCFGMSALGVFLMGINPFLTFVVCVIPRMLTGFLTGLIFELVSKYDKKGSVGTCIVASLLCPIFNTLFFVSAFSLCFGMNPEVLNFFGESSLLGIITVLLTFNALIEAGVCAVIGTAVSKALLVAVGRVRKAK